MTIISFWTIIIVPKHGEDKIIEIHGIDPFNEFQVLVNDEYERIDDQLVGYTPESTVIYTLHKYNKTT